MSNNFENHQRNSAYSLFHMENLTHVKKFNQFDSSVGQKEKFLEMQYCLICEGISLNHTLYPNLTINFIQQESTEYQREKKKKAKNNTWRLESQEVLFPKRNTASSAARHFHCLLSQEHCLTRQPVLTCHRGQEYTEKLLSNQSLKDI